MLRAALDTVAVLACGRRRFLGTFINGAVHRSEVFAVTQRMKVHAEDCAVRKCRYGNALVRHCRRARHLHAPFDILAVGSLRWLSVGSKWNEVNLGMVGLRDKASQHSRE